MSLSNIILVLNVVVAEACKKLWSGKDKSWFRKLLAVGAVLHLLANVAFSVFMLIVSSQNYPGKTMVYITENGEGKPNLGYIISKLYKSYQLDFTVSDTCTIAIINSAPSLMRDNYKNCLQMSSGGKAIMSLQAMESPESQVRLHIDVYSAQTGISRWH